ncbi:MAG: glycosyltransferase family 2 protein [Candidatus Krumholzibacteria bacterium]|nr:glycosyltransferase family 2 protein [Candidatus Krumholzibacteria bacterium]
MKLLAIVPAYNEEGSLPGLIESIRAHLPEADILVVNDCSTDGTAGVVSSAAGIEYLDLPFNMGIGGAVYAGMKYFLSRDYDILVRLDGDGQHPPEQARSLVREVAAGADMAVGSRYILQGGTYSSTMRMMGIKLLAGISRIMLGRAFTDNTSGFRAFSRRAVECLASDFPDDFPEPEEIYILHKNGFSIAEVPVVMKDRTAGISSISLLRTWYFLVKVLLTIFVKYTLGGKR